MLMSRLMADFNLYLMNDVITSVHSSNCGRLDCFRNLLSIVAEDTLSLFQCSKLVFFFCLHGGTHKQS